MPKKKAATKKPAKAMPAKATKPAAGAGDTPKLLKQALAELKSLGNEKVRAQNAKHGAGENQFGVSRGDLRIVANKFKTNHELALALWETGNIDAQFLATLLMKPALLSADEMERLMQSAAWVQVADWLHSYVLKEHADKEALREKWMRTDNPFAARAGWRLTAGRVAKSPEGLDLVALLDRIEREMGSAAEEVQWTMNTCLAEIGINHPKLRKRALAIGENLGLYRDYLTSKGCTSPFAPIWINAMVARQT
jgi:3-methyladenine DNA glycosylase AlkD